MKTVVFVLLLLAGFLLTTAEPDGEEVLRRIDAYRTYGDSFRADIHIRDYEGDALREEAMFRGFFSGDDKSVLICTNGKNKNMKVLMKGDDMWVSLSGSKRALRITPMQRLMGEAANGDVAKITFSRDYTAAVLGGEGGLLKVELRARSRGATYQRAMLFVDAASYMPVRAEFYLLSGKHFKTAYYYPDESRRTIPRIKIEDKLNPRLYTVMETVRVSRHAVPEKYFNVTYLPNLVEE